MIKEKLIRYYRKYRSWRLPYKILFWVIFGILLHFVYVLSLVLVFPPITTTQIQSMLSGNGLKRDYVSLKMISPEMVLAVMASEDQLFPEHYGFDMESIEKAMEYNKQQRKKKRGASTISQQVAKNVFLWQGRSWIRKGLEVYFTLLIETLWSKKRILEMYLNVAEMGKGVFGVEAASQIYFRKPAYKLWTEEAAKIAAALPNPKRYTISPPSAYIQFRLPWVMKQMEQLREDESVMELMDCAWKKSKK